MRLIINIFILSLIAPSIYGATRDDLLNSLAIELNDLRTLPPGTPTRSLCPDETDQLIGFNKKTILEKLGKPNSGNETLVWGYFFSSPFPTNQIGIRGGGQPVLFVTFNESGEVIDILCEYQR